MDPALGPSKGTILVLRAGDALPEVAKDHGEYSVWIERAAGDLWSGAWLEHDLRSSARLPEASDFAAVVITGSPASVTEQVPWMVRAQDYVRRVVESGVPLLGICFGHQLMAQALGGRVLRNPRGREIGTVEVRRLADDPLLDGLPDRFMANATHVDSAVELPRGVTVLASTALEPHAVVAFGERARGVQFHPEIDGNVMRGYVQVRRSLLLEEGLDADAVLAGASETPLARQLVGHFIDRFALSSARRAA